MNTLITYDIGSSVNFPIPFDYLARRFIVVTAIQGTDSKVLVLGVDYRFTTKTTISLIREQAGYGLLEIRRVTGTTRIVNFEDGSILRATDLNTSQLQALHIAEEGRDQTAEVAEKFADMAKDSADAAASSAADAAASSQHVDDVIASAGDKTTLLALADPDRGGNLVVVKQKFTGSVPETLNEFIKVYVSTNNFGTRGSPTPEGATDSTVGIKKALASGAAHVRIDSGYHIVTETIEVPAGVTLEGTGVGYDKKHSVTLMFKGVGAKVNTVSGATSSSVANPDAGRPYLADSGTRGNTYRTNDFTIPFSAGIILNKRSSLISISVIPYFNGVSGYEDTANFNLADEWDVGIWLRNAGGSLVSRCLGQGHWRKAGFLQSAATLPDGLVPECERCQIEFSSFEGFYGGSLRASHGGNLTNYGFAGTTYLNCYFRGLWHNTQHLATSSRLSSPFASPSGCFEIDGTWNDGGNTGKIRGVKFLNCTFKTRDDILIFSDNSSECLFQGCYYEASSVKVNGDWLADSLGARMVATANTQNYYHSDAAQFGVDTSPYFSVKDISIRNSGRYDPSKSGVFSPASTAIDDWQNVVFQNTMGYRMRNATQRFVISGADGTVGFSTNGAGQIVSSGRFDSTGGITMNRTDSTAGGLKPAIRVYGTGNIQVGGGDGATTFTLDGAIAPYADTSSNVGMAAYRFGNVYAANGSINTSDRRHKTRPMEASELELKAFAEIARLPSVWQWIGKYQIEGDGARIHGGVTVQDAIEVMTKHGLKWDDYSCFCYDEWPDMPAVYDEEGVLVREFRPAENIYSLRKDELLWWCLRALTSQFDTLSARMDKLEGGK